MLSKAEDIKKFKKLFKKRWLMKNKNCQILKVKELKIFSSDKIFDYSPLKEHVLVFYQKSLNRRTRAIKTDDKILFQLSRNHLKFQQHKHLMI